jgi:hypothetical protein
VLPAEPRWRAGSTAFSFCTVRIDWYRTARPIGYYPSLDVGYVQV